MLIESLAQKTKLAIVAVWAIVGACSIICIITVMMCLNMVQRERNQIYVLDGDIPFLAERTSLETNFIMEAKAHIQLFHQYFFTLPPDDSYIEWTLSRAMYMSDGSALAQKQALMEKGFFSDIVATSSVCSIMCDSVSFDESTKNFTYYGTQKIQRRSNSQKRSLVTSGSLVNVPRTERNPHGLLITNWRTIENRDLKY